MEETEAPGKEAFIQGHSAFTGGETAPTRSSPESGESSPYMAVTEQSQGHFVFINVLLLLESLSKGWLAQNPRCLFKVEQEREKNILVCINIKAGLFIVIIPVYFIRLV